MILQDYEIELSPIETTIYWWINTLLSKVREIVIYRPHDNYEKQFLEIFYSYMETDWRNLYLNLVNSLTKALANYIPDSCQNTFKLNTAKNGHNWLNGEIAKIIKKEIPDIRLASREGKDTTSYTEPNYAGICYHSCGIMPLSKKQAPTYILTGDQKGLDFYHLMVSTIAILHEKSNQFRSVSRLRERFCTEYIHSANPKITKEQSLTLFNYAFNRASQRGLILGDASKEIYFPNLYEIDLIGLDDYYDSASHYAHLITRKEGKAPLHKKRM